jgi:hypothetical protein
MNNIFERLSSLVEEAGIKPKNKTVVKNAGKLDYFLDLTLSLQEELIGAQKELDNTLGKTIVDYLEDIACDIQTSQELCETYSKEWFNSSFLSIRMKSEIAELLITKTKSIQYNPIWILIRDRNLDYRD